MNTKEAGFLLLTGNLGNPERNPLSVYQFHTLAERMQSAPCPEGDRELDMAYLHTLGYGTAMAQRILALLGDEELLRNYLRRGRHLDCEPISRIHPVYPHALRKKLGLDAPGCLWVKGDATLLQTKMIALVGSRNLKGNNMRFAAEAGRQAAQQGYTLVSGNARGADQIAQDACLEAGGRVISIVADALSKQPLRERVLYVSEDGFDEAFSSRRALSRNRCIHALGEKTFVAQCTLEKGGTWDGSVKNLRFGWSAVFVYDDGTEAANQLMQRGATLISMVDLAEFSALEPDMDNFLTGSE